jgi:L-ribulose-5-phosphate 3-epimerase
MNLGFMQGRLVNSEKKNRIQYFPIKNWKKEILIASTIKEIKLIEWTVNLEKIDKNPLHNYYKLKQIRLELKKYKIKLNSVTCDFFMESPFFKKKNNFQEIDLLKRIIKNSLKLGIKYFILPLVDKSSIKNERQEKYLVQILNKEIYPLIKKTRSMILFEIDYPPKKILKFIKNFNTNKFGINYDTGNSASLNYSFNQEKVYFEFVKNIHIKDRIKFGSTVLLGKGNYKFKPFFEYIKKIRYNGNLILQTARSKDDNHVVELYNNINFVKKFL